MAVPIVSLNHFVLIAVCSVELFDSVLKDLQRF